MIDCFRLDVNLGSGNSDSSPVLRPPPGSLGQGGSGLAPPGDSSPPVIDEPASFSALAWPHQAEPLDATPPQQQQNDSNSASDVDSLLGINSPATSGASAGASTSRGQSSSSVSKYSSKPQILDNVERRANALGILKLICESPVFLHRLEAILCLRDSQGNTPFMAAVANRSYPAAMVLFDAAQKVAKESSNDMETQKKTLMSMVYPNGSPPDDSPLHVVCCNDTCSFTWTGAEHINQDIFECITCGLTDSLCCCTECARTCHKGHACKLKRTSPTAYCDCWEKCKCKATIAGHQGTRYEVLVKLISEAPDLVKLPNSRGENILLFLVQTVGRQQIEQRQHRPSRSRKSATTRKASTSDANEPDMPEHDLDPPKFARKAFERLLNDWNTLRAMIMSGHKDSSNKAIYEDQAFLSSQSGTALLDKFTHCLLVKNSSDMLDTLLNTLIRQIKLQPEVAKIVAKRFVRSVIRVFVVFNIELAPGQAKKRSPLHHHQSSSITQPMQKCKRVFQGLINIAVEELCESANALLAPVRLGVARPTAPFNLSTTSSDLSVEDLFSVEPLAPKPASSPSSASTSRRSRTRSLTVENLRSRNNQVQVAQVEVRPPPVQREAAVIEEELEDNLEVPMQQDFDQNEDSMGNVIEANANNPQEPDEQNPENNPDNEDQQSDMDLDYLAESESDSETENEANENANQNQNENQSGNQNEVFFSDEDTGESSHGEEDESEAGETDEQDGEEFSFSNVGGPAEEILERRTTGVLGSLQDRQNLAPTSMQWAVRPRPRGRPATGGGSNGGYIYIDPASLRRTSSSANAAAAVAAAAAAAGNSSSTSSETTTMSTTAAALSRAFGIVVRTIADLLSLLQDYGPLTPPLNRMLDISYVEAINLQMMIEATLRPNWDWLLLVMDSTEAQLRFGSALANSTDPNQPGHPMSTKTTSRLTTSTAGTTDQPSTSSRAFSAARSSSSLTALATSSGSPATALVVSSHSEGGPASSRRDFLSYALSLMRSHNSEHSDSLPVLDVASMKHIAYVFDSLIYYMRCGNELDLKNAPPLPVAPIEPPENEDENDEENNDNGRRHTFFTRSESTLCLGCPPPDPFATSEPIPLAEQPQLLQPNARREELFGSPKQPLSTATPSTPLSTLPTKLGLASRGSSASFSGSNDAEFNNPSLTRSVSPTTVAATCDTASVRSLDTEMNEPQDLSMSAASSVSSEQDQRTFTSPKKAFMMREAASRAQTAPDVLVVSTESSSNEVTVETSKPLLPRSINSMMSSVPHDILLGRWRLTLDLFGRVFVDDVGLEPGSIISELGGFPVKEAKFRREMEKLRNSRTVDLTLSKLDRERKNLIFQSFKEFNTHFAQNQRRSNHATPPMVVNRVKVTFLNEPGEGSGVARGFYTALAEAVLTNQKLPNLDSAQSSSSSSGSGSLSSAASKSMQFSLIQRLRGTREARMSRSSTSTSGSASGGSGSKSSSRSGRDASKSLSYDARPFVMNGKFENTIFENG